MNFTDLGYTPRTVLEIRDSIVAKMKATFGENFDVTSSSPDGQIIGIVAQEIWTQEQEGFALYQSLSPYLASGVALDYVVGYNDITRIVDRPCKVILTLTGVQGTLVPKGFVVETSDLVAEKLQFTTDSDVLLPATVAATCTKLGEYNVNAGEVTIIPTALAGLTSVTNLEDGSRGIPYESDSQLRARRNRTVEAQGRQSASTVQAALISLGVDYLAVIENDTDATVDGVPPHSFEVVVKGGEPNQIARLINAERPLGIRAHGSTIVPITDSLGQVRQIGFTRPSIQEVAIVVTIEKKAGASNDVEAQIKKAMIAELESLNVGEDVEWASLFAPITGIENIKIKTILVGKVGEALGTVGVPINSRQYAKTTSDLVSVVIE